MQRWKDGGWETLEEAMDAYRRMIFVTLAEWEETWGGEPCDFYSVDRRFHEALYWLIEGAPWSPGILGFHIEPDGRGNHRFVAVALGELHPFSTHRALHGDFTPPKRPVDPDNPFEGLVS